MPEFGLKKSFDIDHGELDGLRRNECFVLGYELALVDKALEETEKAIACPVHSINRERIEKSCRNAGREFSLTFMADDPSESWLWLMVAPAGKAMS